MKEKKKSPNNTLSHSKRIRPDAPIQSLRTSFPLSTKIEHETIVSTHLSTLKPLAILERIHHDAPIQRFRTNSPPSSKIEHENIASSCLLASKPLKNTISHHQHSATSPIQKYPTHLTNHWRPKCDFK